MFNCTQYHKTSKAALPVQRLSKCVNSLEDSHGILLPSRSRRETCALYAIAIRYHINQIQTYKSLPDSFGYNGDTMTGIDRKILGEARRSHNLYYTKIKWEWTL